MGSVNGKVVSVMDTKNYQMNSLGIFSGNHPVKNCRKLFTESFFRSVMLVVTMVLGMDSHSALTKWRLLLDYLSSLFRFCEKIRA